MLRIRTLFIAMTLLASALVMADEKANVGPNNAAQSAADVLRSFTSADVAFIGAGLLNETYSKDDLSTLLHYPTDEVVVINLPGSMIRQALERSVSLYPQPNPSFLQLSGVEAVFRKSGAPNSRIVSVTVGGVPLADGKTYTVAMPALLAKGGLGYFNVWDDAKVAKRFDKTTLESVLKGKRTTEGAPRWTGQG